MISPLRGEVTRPSLSAPSQPDKNFDKIHSVLSEFVRLLSTPRSPQVTIPPALQNLDPSSKDVAAPWSWTAGEVANTEAVLIPFLIHIAAARNDLIGLTFCLETVTASDSGISVNIAGGLVNCLDPSTRQSPLHVASLNGSVECVGLLLRSGALVHLRDVLGHTALYYVCRRLERYDVLKTYLYTLGCSPGT